MSWLSDRGGSDEALEHQQFADDPFFLSSSPTPSAPSTSRQLPETERRVFRERVLVRVYDLGQTFWTRLHNQITKSYGAFHTGVEVYGREWCFGMTFDDFSTGITSNMPAKNPDHTFRETLSMGYTSLSPREVAQLLDEMRLEWKGKKYNVLSKNCHHFSDAFCAELGVAKLPSWINTLANTGAVTVDFLDSADSGYDGGEALYNFADNVKSSVFGIFSNGSQTQSDNSRQSAGGNAAATYWR